VTTPLVIHGHFYQPPRENPWSNYIDGEPSAHPFPDWNARVQAECYRPNATTRITDGYGRIENIVNNYGNISFNFGPTLLSWMELHDPDTYARILAADRESVGRHGGHGNAIAQAYNHTILPLCNDRDRVTQVRWGMADFRHRFGREPESLWLPETACNEDTLDTLIDEGLRYVILSPFQAQRVRPLGAGEEDWEDVSDGQVDPTQAYLRYHRDGSGRSIALFFYDGQLARGIAFEGALATSQALVSHLHQPEPAEGRLVQTATDGESYGHHTKWGDRSLAHALMHEAPQHCFAPSNYGVFLEANPPRMEAELKPGPGGEGTSWSCAHGVGRWYRDCGCHTGGEANWNQAWRGPLRDALNLLRDHAAHIFETQGAELLKDPWAARDAYIALVLNRPANHFDFFHEHATRVLSEAEQVRALTLLELQRFAMLMYTSCGWFFSDLSGIETVQVMKYAARVMDLIGELEADVPRDAFLEVMAQAESNIPEHGNGAEVFRSMAEVSRISPRSLAAHLGISWLVAEDLEREVAAGYHYVRELARKESRGRITLATCRLTLESLATGSRHDFSLAAMHFGGIDFYCALKPYPGDARFKSASRRLWSRFSGASLPQLLRQVERDFGPEEFGLDNVLPGGRRRIAEVMFGNLVDTFAEQYARLYEDNRRIVEMLADSGLELPAELRTAAEYTLRRRFEEEIRRQQRSADPEAYERAVEISQEMARHGLAVTAGESGRIFDDIITGAVQSAIDEDTDEQWEVAGQLIALARRLRVQPSLEQAQNLFFDAVLAPQRPLSDAMRMVALRLRFSPVLVGHNDRGTSRGLTPPGTHDPQTTEL